MPKWFPLAAFRSGATRILVATDVAARGLDVAHVTAVVNTSLGISVENYVHRVGRCGRAGATGVATTFVVDGDEANVPGSDFRRAMVFSVSPSAPRLARYSMSS